MQSDFPPKQELAALYKDFPIVGTQTSGWRNFEDSERGSSLARPSLPDLMQRGATLEPFFDILKKMDVLNFEWVEVVRGLQTAEARIQELQARSPGEYVIFSQRTQQIVASFNSRAAGEVANGSENPRKTPDVS
jgi:hypothetical protein